MVKSVDAFNDAAREQRQSRNIQVGYYQLKKEMKASDALAVLVDPENLIQSLVVVPEGARVRQIVETIVTRDRPPEAGRDRGARQPGGDRAAGGGPGQPRGLPVPGDLHGAARSRPLSA